MKRCSGCAEEKVLERRAYYIAHRDELVANMRAYYAANRVTLLAQKREWRQQNRAALMQRRYEARCAALGIEPVGTVTEADLIAVVATRGGLCAYCEEREAQTVDHIIPVARGGPHISENLAPACLPCNSSKGDKTVEEWIGA